MDREYAGKTAAQLSEAWASASREVAKEGASSQAALAGQSLLVHWAAKDGRAAAAAVLKLPPSPFKSKSFSLVMEAWANNHPPEAAAWYFDPRQAELRRSKDLVAGPKFAKKVFQTAALAQQTDIAANIDKLTHAPEMWGAVEGLHRAYRIQGRGDDAIRETLKTVKENSRVVRTIQKLCEAIGDSDTVIADPAARSQLLEIISERLDR